MLAAIVLLDIRGFSSLTDPAKRSFFFEFLPFVRELLDQERPKQALLDANTWGDSVLAVFNDSSIAADFAQSVAHAIATRTWKDDALYDLGVRIALHVTELECSTDPVRELAQVGKHVYGSGLVLPARLEPKVIPNSIWVTDQARPHVQEAIDRKKLRGVLIDIGDVELPKKAGVCRAHWLAPPGTDRNTVLTSPAPSIAAPDLPSFLRMPSVQTLSRLCGAFKAFACGCDDRQALDSAFGQYHASMLSSLRVRTATGEVLETDILEVDFETGELKMRQEPTCIDNRRWLPDPPIRMRIDGGNGTYLRPQDQDGIAAYCVWANTVGMVGVTVALDVHESANAFHCERRYLPDPIGLYERKPIANMYKPAGKGGARPPYRSILSAPISEVLQASSKPDEPVQVKAVGVLNITSTKEDAFNDEDFAWAETCAALMSSFYGDYRAAIQRIVA